MMKIQKNNYYLCRESTRGG